MEDYSAMIRSTFEMGSIRDAETLFEAIIQNAFPTFHFRRLELGLCRPPDKQNHNQQQPYL